MREASAGREWDEPRDLGNGLRLRWSCSADTGVIRQLIGDVFRESPEGPPREPIVRWIDDLMSGEHPLMGPGDFVLIEDTNLTMPRVVAVTCYWHHTWTYGNIPLRVGRPEFVATDPAYRQRGLIRALFQELHRRSLSEGDLMQAITGIPYFYRLFEYEYALPLAGGRIVPLASIPDQQHGMAEPYLLRDALEEDIPLLQSLYAQSFQDQVIVTCIEEEWWRYQLTHWRNSQTGEHWHIRLILDQVGNVWGYLVTPVVRVQPNLVVWSIALVQGINLLILLPSLLRALRQEDEHLPVAPAAGKMTGIYFRQGQQHPLYEVLDSLFAPQRERSYAWYIRVPDLERFLLRVAPVLEARLANSLLVGYTGGLKLDFYRSGLRLAFAQGRLIAVERWERSTWHGVADASFPPHVFLQLLFGYRSLDELYSAFPDVEAKEEAALVLKALFPAYSSLVIPLG